MKRLLMAAIALAGLQACVGGNVRTGVTPSATVLYLEVADSADRLEILSGEMALRNARSAEVRSFARTLVADHERAARQRRRAAEAAEITVPAPALVSHHWAMFERLRDSGPNFDAEFRALRIAAHEEALALHRGYAQAGEIPRLQTVAAATVPMIEQHLQHARRLPGSTVPVPHPAVPHHAVPPPSGVQPELPPGERG